MPTIQHINVMYTGILTEVFVPTVVQELFHPLYIPIFIKLKGGKYAF